MWEHLRQQLTIKMRLQEESFKTAVIEKQYASLQLKINILLRRELQRDPLLLINKNICVVFENFICTKKKKNYIYTTNKRFSTDK